MMSKGLPVVFVIALAVYAQSSTSLDPRLTVSTLVREDIFAGYLANDMDRFALGEKNLELLLRERPKDKPGIFAWQASAALYKAVRSHEQKQNGEADGHYNRASELFRQAYAVDPESEAVAAITGGSYSMFVDRLPEKYRTEATAKAYQAYKLLLAKQGPSLEKMPLHHKGEVLAGLAQSALRTGHAEEGSQYLDRIITLLPNTPYEARARKWKENPELASRTTIVCMTCHEAGKLEARRAALVAK